jgi:hypothetical protein
MAVTSNVPNIFSNGVVMSSADMIENYNHIIDDVNNNAVGDQNPIIQAMPYGNFIPEELADANKVMANFEHIRSQINDRATSIGPISAFPHNIQNEQVNDADQVNENFQHLVDEINGVVPGLGGDLVLMGISNPSSPYIFNPYVSTDSGANWVAQASFDPASDEAKVFGEYGNSSYCVLGGDNVQNSLISSNGSSWSENSMPSGPEWYSIEYNGSIFVASARNSRNIATSSDGITWTEHTNAVPASFGATGFGGIAWNGSLFVGASDAPLGKIATSPDGITWTEQTTPATSANFGGVVWNGSIFLAYANTLQTAITSPDGITWTQNNIASLGGSNTIAYGNGRFVHVGSNSQNTRWSTDGIGWNAGGTLSFPNAPDLLVFNGDVFVGIDVTNGLTFTSTNGDSWTTLSNLPNGFGVFYRALITTHKEFGTY